MISFACQQKHMVNLLFLAQFKLSWMLWCCIHVMLCVWGGRGPGEGWCVGILLSVGGCLSITQLMLKFIYKVYTFSFNKKSTMWIFRFIMYLFLNKSKIGIKRIIPQCLKSFQYISTLIRVTKLVNQICGKGYAENLISKHIHACTISNLHFNVIDGNYFIDAVGFNLKVKSTSP